MPQRHFGGTSLLYARFAISPLWETVASLRVLHRAQSFGFHSGWADRTRRRLQHQRINPALLMALVPATGHLADFLTPAPASREASFSQELHSLRATPAEALASDVEMLLTQQPGPAGGEVLEAAADHQAFLAAVTADLQKYWSAAVEPYWPRLRALAQADIQWRAEQFAAGGVNEMLRNLHPRVRTEGSRLEVQTTCERRTPAGDDRGLVMVPCAFAWPGILLLDSPRSQPTLTYAPRGVGGLWREQDSARAPLTGALGRTKSAALLQLDLPMNTLQLAHQLGFSAPTVNTHLKDLERAGLVSAARQGREVLYSRTELGERLASGSGVPL